MRLFILFLMLIGFSVSTFSQTMSVGTIKAIRTGLNSEQFTIVTNEQYQNPAGCFKPDGYVADSSHKGYYTYYAAALMAFMERSQIAVTISNKPGDCINGRPRLIGINLQRGK
ncbi:hypothetical protein [Nitrosomonas sp. Is37]|uniref:hypothetical protein n=1 Tax=Nitrosomonas sp. Is37 TaxID=3080535 RepID=UPI00294B28B3|nr:hypothetical protein [Nitrosomonas sp. Is37]MDV6344738.1 hypothetical protein [Nitrosomonas sp. Is37]